MMVGRAFVSAVPIVQPARRATIQFVAPGNRLETLGAAMPGRLVAVTDVGASPAGPACPVADVSASTTRIGKDVFHTFMPHNDFHPNENHLQYLNRNYYH
jgi:hypothetical protein